LPELCLTLAGDPSAPIQWEGLLRSFNPDLVSVQFVSDFWDLVKDADVPRVAYQLARSRVLTASSPSLNEEVLPMEQKYEEANLRRKESRKVGPVYSGLQFLALCRDVLAEARLSFAEILRTVVVTPQRLGTYETDRWHLRTILVGAPTVISVTGFVEAPARPREYYVLKQSDPILANDFLKARDDWLSHDDPRLTLVARGYLLKAIYFMTDPAGFQFCGDRNCVFSDPHWQSDLVRTHASEPVPLCTQHSAFLRFLRVTGSAREAETSAP
jgi:hypothetical protein